MFSKTSLISYQQYLLQHLLGESFYDGYRARSEEILSLLFRDYHQRSFNIDLGEFDSEMEAALAYDRAAVLIYGDTIAQRGTARMRGKAAK